MKLTMTPEIAQWFDDNMVVQEGDGIQVGVKIYSSSPINRNMGIVLQQRRPDQPVAEVTTPAGTKVFVDQQDAWFFEGYDLEIIFNEVLEGPDYIYYQDGQAINQPTACGTF